MKVRNPKAPVSVSVRTTCTMTGSRKFSLGLNSTDGESPGVSSCIVAGDMSAGDVLRVYSVVPHPD